jgi:hypothetical protein
MGAAVSKLAWLKQLFDYSTDVDFGVRIRVLIDGLTRVCRGKFSHQITKVTSRKISNSFAEVRFNDPVSPVCPVITSPVPSPSLSCYHGSLRFLSNPFQRTSLYNNTAQQLLTGEI